MTKVCFEQSGKARTGNLTNRQIQPNYPRRHLSLFYILVIYLIPGNKNPVKRFLLKKVCSNECLPTSLWPKKKKMINCRRLYSDNGQGTIVIVSGGEIPVCRRERLIAGKVQNL
jgi:hypothetical protein